MNKSERNNSTSQASCPDAAAPDERLLRVAFDAAQMGTWVYSFDTGYVVCDATAQRLYGLADPNWKHDEAGVRGVLHEDDIEAMWEAVGAACDPCGTGKYEAEYRILLGEGRVRWLSAWGVVEFEGEGNQRRAVRMLGATRDITTSKQAVEQLEFQKYALDQASIVAITDVRGTITYVNDKFCEISGYSREELVGQNHRILNSGLHPREFFRDMYATIARGQVWRGEIRNRRKDGTFYWVDTTIVPSLGPHGKPESYVAIRNDITERKRALEQLEFQKYALDQASIVAITDVRGTITYVNDKFCEISGYSREELVGQNHRILNSGLHPREFFRDMYATIARGQVWRGEIRNRRKDGTFYWVDTTIVPSLGPHGKPDSYVAIRNDITERKQHEEALRNANTDLLQFASAASHDLKEPLRGISRLICFIRDDQDGLSEETLLRLDRVRTLCQRLSMMVDGLLEHARSGLEPRIAPCDVSGIIRRVVDTSAEELAERNCEITLCGNLPMLLGDSVLLERVFANLIANAVKFNDSPLKRIEIFWEPAAGGEWGAVAIRDNGIGIDPRHHAAAFRIFKRVHSPEKYPGLGLGLALARKIIEAHGGSLELESSLGQGSTFRVRLPVAAPAAGDGSPEVLISPAFAVREFSRRGPIPRAGRLDDAPAERRWKGPDRQNGPRG